MTNNIEISLGNVIQFNYPDASKLKRVLILGNTKNFFGKPWDEIEKQNENDINNVCFFRDLLENKVSTVIIGEQNGENEEFEYYENLIKELKNFGIDTQNFYKFFKFYATKNDDDYIAYLNELNRRNMKFDYIIQNPPYAGSLHLDIFDKTLDLIDPKGKMTIIEPATWLINVRKNGKAKKYDAIKERLKGHVYKVVIENFNKEFQVGLKTPCSITYIDMDNVYDEIEFVCCGETKQVKSLYDCNLIGSYDMIWNILNKITKFPILKDRFISYTKDTTYLNAAYCSVCNRFLTTIGSGHNMESDKEWIFDNKNNLWILYSFKGSIIEGNISDIRPVGVKGKVKDTLYYNKYTNYADNAKLLESLNMVATTTNLFHFISSVVIIDDQGADKVLQFIPDIDYTKYNTDEELNKFFNFSEEEICFINKTVQKFERYSPWLKRLWNGPTSVSDEEVQRFCDELNKNK